MGGLTTGQGGGGLLGGACLCFVSVGGGVLGGTSALTAECWGSSFFRAGLANEEGTSGGLQVGLEMGNLPFGGKAGLQGGPVCEEQKLGFSTCGGRHNVNHMHWLWKQTGDSAILEY